MPVVLDAVVVGKELPATPGWSSAPRIGVVAMARGGLGGVPSGFEPGTRPEVHCSVQLLSDETGGGAPWLRNWRMTSVQVPLSCAGVMPSKIESDPFSGWKCPDGEVWPRTDRAASSSKTR